MNAPPSQPTKAFKPVWGLLAILVGVCAIVTVRGLIWTDIIPWRHDFESAAVEAERSGKPRLLYFASDFCDPCEQMRHTTWASRRVAAALTRYVPVKIDFLKERELDKEYGVEAIPTMMVLDSGGHVVKATTGGADADEFLQWLR